MCSTDIAVQHFFTNLHFKKQCPPSSSKRQHTGQRVSMSIPLLWIRDRRGRLLCANLHVGIACSSQTRKKKVPTHTDPHNCNLRGLPFPIKNFYWREQVYVALPIIFFFHQESTQNRESISISPLHAPVTAAAKIRFEQNKSAHESLSKGHRRSP